MFYSCDCVCCLSLAEITGFLYKETQEAKTRTWYGSEWGNKNLGEHNHFQWRMEFQIFFELTSDLGSLL